jgi:hypothetical protein
MRHQKEFNIYVSASLFNTYLYTTPLNEFSNESCETTQARLRRRCCRNALSLLRCLLPTLVFLQRRLNACMPASLLNLPSHQFNIYIPETIGPHLIVVHPERQRQRATSIIRAAEQSFDHLYIVNSTVKQIAWQWKQSTSFHTGLIKS